jgi:hypothetical protein
MMENTMGITLHTSAKDAVLLDCAMRRAVPGTRQYSFLCRIERSLNTWGTLTEAMTAAVIATIQPSSR